VTKSLNVLEKDGAVLRESERRFREIIDALPTAIYTTDAKGRLTHFNPACVAFSGRTPPAVAATIGASPGSCIIRMARPCHTMRAPWRLR